MTPVRWTAPARADLKRINTWLTEEVGLDFAARTMAAIRYRSTFLVDFPRGGRPFRGDLRILRVLDTSYLILYRIVGDMHVQVLRVYHERENWQVKVV